MSLGRCAAALVCAVSLALAADGAARSAGHGAPVAGGAARFAARAAAAPVTGPATHADLAEGGVRLDLAAAGLAQTTSTDIELVLRTHAPWQPSDVDPSRGGMLCVWLRGPGASAPGGRLCVVPRAQARSGLGLRYTPLDGAGRSRGLRELSAVVRRPQPTTARASFAPGALHLASGRYRWRAAAGRIKGSEDRLPDSGELEVRIASTTSPLALRRCFGAAAREQRSCDDPRLRLASIPAPQDAIFSLNSPCVMAKAPHPLAPCWFGVPAADARTTVALLGDSHASQWRGALEAVAQHKRWRGVSITRSGCAYSRAKPKLEPDSRRAACARWNALLPGWFRRHPQVSVAVVVAHYAVAVQVAPGADERATRIDGFAAAWARLPRSVKRIVVIRDTPVLGFGANECVERALARRRNPGLACARPRAEVLRPDPAVAAAQRRSGDRARAIDLTRLLCSPRRCFPVIGGALVYKDDQHFTDVFSETLAPALRRALDRV
jgi:hypothetical protein